MNRTRLRAVPEKAKILIIDAEDYEVAYKDLAAGTTEVTIQVSAE